MARGDEDVASSDADDRPPLPPCLWTAENATGTCRESPRIRSVVYVRVRIEKGKSVHTSHVFAPSNLTFTIKFSSTTAVSDFYRTNSRIINPAFIESALTKRRALRPVPLPVL